MKRLIVAVCAVMLVVLILFGGRRSGKSPAPDILSVSEAAFSVRNSESRDATSALVGRYESTDGNRLNFDGAGEVNDIAVNLTMTTGRYSVLQTEDAAVLQMEFDGVVKLYSVTPASEHGGFILTGEDGSTATYYPIL